MPWLVAEVSAEIESIITSRDVITGERLLTRSYRYLINVHPCFLFLTHVSRFTEIVREVVEARGELYASSGARDLDLIENAPPDSITPPSLPEGEGEEREEREYPALHELFEMGKRLAKKMTTVERKYRARTRSQG